MKKKRGFKRVVKTFVDIPTWIGASFLTNSWHSIADTFKTVYAEKTPRRTEEFNDAVARLKLSEQDLQDRIKKFTALLYFYLALSALVLIYTVYLILEGSYKGAMVSFAITFMISTQAFRYHFWRFQIQQRRLGCTFKEWLNSSFLGGKK